MDADEAVRVAVLTGAGDAVVLRGQRHRRGWTRTPIRGSSATGATTATTLRELRKPVIAAVNGYAYGGGLELALSCDIRLASRTASFAAAEIKLGWIGGGGVSALLSASVPASDAALLLLTGDPVDAAEALPDGPGQPAARSRMTCCPPRSRWPAPSRSGRRSPRSRPRPTCWPPGTWGWRQAIQYEREMQAICLATQDAAEGRQAFGQKRPGRFTGR